MTKFLIPVLAIAGLIIPAVVQAQQNAKNIPDTLGVVMYTDQQLSEYGLTEIDIASYHRYLQGKEGKWWGHLSPIELMMYAAETEQERIRFARLYLTSTFPKALAERDAMRTMYRVSREILIEQIGSDGVHIQKRPLLFVNLNCESCQSEVTTLINEAGGIVDIYVTELDPDQKPDAQLITWAQSLALPANKVTLNDDRGIFQKKFGYRLERYYAVSP